MWNVLDALSKKIILSKRMKVKTMKKTKNDSIAVGMCIGVGIGMIVDNPILGIAIGAGIGATGALSNKKKK